MFLTSKKWENTIIVQSKQNRISQTLKHTRKLKVYVTEIYDNDNCSVINDNAALTISMQDSTGCIIL